MIPNPQELELKWMGSQPVGIMGTELASLTISLAPGVAFRACGDYFLHRCQESNLSQAVVVHAFNRVLESQRQEDP